MHSPPLTLREIAGLPKRPAALAESVLIIVDAQKEYTEGLLPLPNIRPAIEQIAGLVARARRIGAPVIHIVQHGKPGGRICNPAGPFVAVIDELLPLAGETAIVKSLPSSFKATTLDEELRKIGRRDLVIVGFMTHMCVNSTTRDAAELGYRCTVVASACGTRDLPDGAGGVIPAATIHAANLAALRDRFAVVVSAPDDIP